jgi:hypothetical protein
MAKRTDDDPFDEWLVQPDCEAHDEEELDSAVQRQWQEMLERLRDLCAFEDSPERAVSMKIEWKHGSAFNHGRVGNTGVRIERYNVGDKTHPKWRFMLADDEITYLHIDDREFATREELENAAIRWLVDAGRLTWLN